MTELNKIYQGDCLEVLKTFQDGSVNCCVTSPPYYGLRDYGEDGQIGLEPTPEEYVDKMVKVFAEVRRILKKDGTLWLNLGDSYCATATGSGDQKSSTLQGGKKNQIEAGKRPSKNNLPGLKPKDLIGVPWMLAFALRADGWYLRQDIIWNKPNPMPESVTDRCTKSHEYIFLLSKSRKYYFDGDAIATPILDQSLARLAQDLENQKGSDRVPGKTNGTMKAVRKQYDPTMSGGGSKINGHNGSFDRDGNLIGGTMANKRSVWTVNTMPYSEAHFATFPERLIVDCIKAGCPEDGIVLDPFMGAGTTALVARKLDRNYIGVELNPSYIEIAEKRLKTTLGLFL